MSVKNTVDSMADSVTNTNTAQPEETRNNKTLCEYIKPGCYVAPKIKCHREASIFLKKYPLQWCPWSPATYIVDVNGKVYYLMDIINGNFGYELQFQGKQNLETDTTVSHLDTRSLHECYLDEQLDPTIHMSMSAALQIRNDDTTHGRVLIQSNNLLCTSTSRTVTGSGYKRRILNNQIFEESIPSFKKSKNDLD